MPKNVDDITHTPPIERRSIRNIPIPEKRRKTDFVDSVAPASLFGSSTKSESLSYIPKRSTDIIPPHKRSTDTANSNSIHIPIHKKVSEDIPKLNIQERRSADRRSGGDRRNTKRNIFLVSALIVGALLAGLFSLSSGATMTYTPKSTSLTFNKDSYTAFKTGGPGQLLFSVIKLSDNKGISAQASGEENVSLKSSGKAIVYNNNGPEAQRLIKNTRFSTAEGKVFRIQGDITIPGKKGSEPGSLEVTLFADQAGADYNIGLSDFTLPGLAGDPKFKTVYARSKTPMTGGFVGIAKKVSDADLSKTKNSLETSLKNQLIDEAKAQVPEDFILYPNLVQVTYSNLPQTNQTSSGVTVNEQADFYGVMFKKSDLENYLSSKKVSDTSLLPVSIINLSTLDASFTNSSTDDLLKAEQVNINFSGQGMAVSLIGESNLKNDLLGISKNSLGNVLKKYPNILNASAVVRPFWKTSFPNDVSKITLIKPPLK